MREDKQRPADSANDFYLRQSYHRVIHKSEASVNGDNDWLITLSDVFTLLLVFMIALMVMTKKTAGSDGSVKHIEIKAAVDSDYEQSIIATGIRDEIAGRVNNLDLAEEVSVLAKGREVVVIMKEKITFMPGQAEVLESSRSILDKIAGIINSYPGFIVEISGHTDNVPIQTHLYPSNWELSVARAASVLKYFINTHSIGPSRLSIKGNAEQKPLTSNDSPENRAKNRRVEIRFIQSEA